MVSFTERTDNEVKALASTQFTTDLAAADTDDVSEGNNNLYHTTARVRGAISAGTGISIAAGAIAIANAGVQPEHLSGMKGSVWEKISGTSTVVPTTTIRGHCGAWTLDIVEGILHQLNWVTFPSDPINSTDSSFSRDSAVWLFDTAATYNLPDTYWESDSSGNILFDA